MAVTSFRSNATAGAASVGARTLLHTGTSGATLVVWIHSNESTTYSAVAAGTLPMTLLTAVSAGTSRLEMWGLTSVPTGTLTISAIPAGTQVATWCMAATTFTGARNLGGSPFGTPVGGTAAAAATVDLSISSTSTDVVAFGFGISANTSLTINNGTTRASATHSTTGRLVIGDITGATTISVSATAGAGTPQWGWAAVPIIAAATPITAIQFDNAAQTATNVNANSRGLLLTATSGAVLLVWTIADLDSNTVESVVINDTINLTFLGAANGRDGIGLRAELWGLTAPPSGILTISAVLANATTTTWGIIGATYTGHKTTGTPFGGVVTGTGSATTTVALIISSSATDMIVTGFGLQGLPVSADGALTTRTTTTGTFPAMVLADAPGLPAVTAIARKSSTNFWATIGINLLGSTGAAFISANAAFTDPADTFSASAQVRVTARLSATDAPDTFSMSAKARITGAIAFTDPADTFSSAAKVRITSRLSATEAFADTFSSSANVRVTARLSATDAADIFSSSAQVRITSRLSATDAQDTFAGLGQVRITARLSATDAQDLFSASANLVSDYITARLSATDATDLFSSSANVRITARLSATDATDIFAATATVLNTYISANVAFTDTPDLFSSSARVRVTAFFAATDRQDTFVASANNISPSVEAVVVQDLGSGGGYERASESFWTARERYLRSLFPELEEPDLIDPPPHSVEVPNTVPNPANPALLLVYQIERRKLVSALPQATSMRQLYDYGARLRRVNARIAEQRYLQTVAEIAARYRAEKRRQRQNMIKKARKQVTLLAAARAAQIARSLYFLYGKK